MYFTVSFDVDTGQFVVEDSDCDRSMKNLIQFKLNYQFDDGLIEEIGDSFEG